MIEAGARVAFTGCTGFLGPHIAAALAASGRRVRALVRTPRPDLPFETVVGDLADAHALDTLLDGADAVVHAAGLIKARSAAAFYAVNRDGSRALGEAVRRRNDPVRVVAISTLAAREPGLSDYAASKAAGEVELGRLCPDLVILRPTAVYGPGDRETAVFLKACAGPLLPLPRVPGGRVTLIHAADVAAAVVAACDPDFPTGVFELTDADTSGHSWADLGTAIRTAADSRAAVVQLPRIAFLAAACAQRAAAAVSGRAPILSRGKVRELFHPDWSSAVDRQPPARLWQPRISLAQGLAETAAWLGGAPSTQGCPNHAR